MNVQAGLAKRVVYVERLEDIGYPHLACLRQSSHAYIRFPQQITAERQGGIVKGDL